MFGLSVKARLTVGLVGILSSVLLFASFLGLVPSYQRALLDGRARTCELIAVNTSALANHVTTEQLSAVIQATVKRNDDILSAAVRRQDGTLLVVAGKHETLWKPPKSGKSTATQVRVPIHGRQGKWGDVELRFADAAVPWGGLAFGAEWRMLAFVSATCGIVFFFVLGKSLEQLDPSKAVPQQVQGALDQLAEGLVITDRQGRVAFVNETFSLWQGKPVRELIGQSADDFEMRFADGYLGNELPWTCALREERPQSGVSLLLVDTNGLERHLKAYSSPVLGTDGNYRGVLTSFEDVTALVESKVELGQAKYEAEEANRTKSDFLARMSHEIRTPMNAILGYTEILLHNYDESRVERQEYLENIYSSGEHLLALINSILDISKIEAGRMELEQITESPYRLITQAISLVQNDADAKGVTLEFKCGSLPKTITTDPTRFRQIVVNLLSNAVKFTDEGAVTVTAGMQRAQPSLLERWKMLGGSEDDSVNRSVLEIAVEDSGIGMDQEALEKVFEPFAQADTSITRRFGGTGLGLSICLRLAEAMGGEISAESKLGVGSKFTLHIPCENLDAIDMASGDDLQAGLRDQLTQPKRRTRLPKCRILVVDDGESNRKLIALILRRAGAIVECVENGLDGYALAMHEDFDIILMDMQMPIMDGYTAVRKLRAEGYDRPVIALTAHAMLGDEEKCRMAGCTGFITKPVERSKLVTAIADLLPEEFANFEREQIVEETLVPRESSGQSDARLGSEPIFSTLPTGDDEFREIVVEFTARLRRQIVDVHDAWERHDFTAIADFAHRLKGSGGTAGFAEFTSPARDLEEAAQRQDGEATQALIAVIDALVERIRVPAETAEVSCT